MPKITLTIIVTLLLIFLSGCNETPKDKVVDTENSFSLENLYPYDDVVSKNKEEIDQTDLKSLIQFEKISFSIKPESEIERRMSFNFSVQNITSEMMTLSYIGYFPRDLYNYYLSSLSIRQTPIEIKPNQILDVFDSILISLEKDMQLAQKNLLKENGHEAYFVFSINDKLYYDTIVLDELGVHKW